MEKRAEALNEERNSRIKYSLRAKPLLETIPLSPSKKKPLEDGILLFGKHSGRKISSLLRGYEESSYVLEYLAKNEDLPKHFRNQIDQIIEVVDPWGDTSIPIDELEERPPLSFNVRDVTDEEEDLPW